MIDNADKLLLQETYKNSNMAIKAINTIISKVEDDELSHDLNNQMVKYKQIEKKANEQLVSLGESAEESLRLQETMIKTSIQANTLLDRSTGHIADMIIKGNTMGMVELTKTINENKDANHKVKSIANDLVKLEENNIKLLKSYL